MGLERNPNSALFPQTAGNCSASSRYNCAVDFAIRDGCQEDFETLWGIDQRCFAPGIAYSQRELRSYIRRRSAFTLVAERPPHDGTGGQSAILEIIGFLVAEAG